MPPLPSLIFLFLYFLILFILGVNVDEFVESRPSLDRVFSVLDLFSIVGAIDVALLDGWR